MRKRMATLDGVVSSKTLETTFDAHDHSTMRLVLLRHELLTDKRELSSRTPVRQRSLLRRVNIVNVQEVLFKGTKYYTLATIEGIWMNIS